MRTVAHVLASAVVAVIWSAGPAVSQPPASPPQPAFQKVASAEGRFTAEMPGKPQERVEEAGGQARLKVHTWTARAADGSIYAIIWSNLDGVDLTDKDPQELLQAFRQSSFQGQDAKLVEDAPLVYGAARIPGRAYLMELKRGFSRERIYLAGSRLYRVGVAGTKAAVMSKEADNFFNSFAIDGADRRRFTFRKETSAEGRFTVELPGRIEELVEDLRREGDGARVKTHYRTGRPTRNSSFSVIWAELPASDLEGKSPQQVLRAYRDERTRGLIAKTVEDKEITLAAGKLPGREYLLEFKDGFARNRLYLSGNRAYTLTITGPKEVVTSDDADRFFASFAFTAATAGNAGFRKVTSAAGRFIAEMPGEPKENVRDFTRPSDQAKFKFVEHRVEVGGGAGYIVNWFDYPDVDVKGKTAQEVIKTFQRRTLGEGTLIEDKVIALGKVPGREYLAELKRGFTRERLYLDGHRLYRAIVVGSKEFCTSKDADRFFASFAITAGRGG